MVLSMYTQRGGGLRKLSAGARVHVCICIYMYSHSVAKRATGGGYEYIDGAGGRTCIPVGSTRVQLKKSSN